MLLTPLLTLSSWPQQQSVVLQRPSIGKPLGRNTEHCSMQEVTRPVSAGRLPASNSSAHPAPPSCRQWQPAHWRKRWPHSARWRWAAGRPRTRVARAALPAATAPPPCLPQVLQHRSAVWWTCRRPGITPTPLRTEAGHSHGPRVPHRLLQQHRHHACTRMG